MILYALACINGHRFESWFRSSAGYDEQAGRNLIACPVCQSAQVAKTIMAPAVVSRDSVGRQALDTASDAASTSSLPVPVASAGPPLLDERQMAARTFLKSMRDRVLKEGEDVGDKFPDQARKMHEGDIPHRHIHGQATLEEARSLIEDGVAILPLPLLPEELN